MITALLIVGLTVLGLCGFLAVGVAVLICRGDDADRTGAR